MALKHNLNSIGEALSRVEGKIDSLLSESKGISSGGSTPPKVRDPNAPVVLNEVGEGIVVAANLRAVVDSHYDTVKKELEIDTILSKSHLEQSLRRVLCGYRRIFPAEKVKLMDDVAQERTGDGRVLVTLLVLLYREKILKEHPEL